MTNALPSDEFARDARIFIDDRVYNCPFCNRRSVGYLLTNIVTFDWTQEEPCVAFTVRCESCQHTSLHFTFGGVVRREHQQWSMAPGSDLDEQVFYSVPSSFFAMDSRVPRGLRALITEAEGCLRLNFVTAAAACTRSAIDDLLVLQASHGERYRDRLANLRHRFPEVSAGLFDVLERADETTFRGVHERPGYKSDARRLRVILATLRSLLYEIYVLTDERARRSPRMGRVIREALEKKTTKHRRPSEDASEK